MAASRIPEGAVKAAAAQITPTPAGLKSPPVHLSLVRFGLEAAEPIIRSSIEAELREEQERLKALVEDAYCVEEFLRKVLRWEGSAEDELTEAIEAAEKLSAALDTSEDSDV